MESWLMVVNCVGRQAGSSSCIHRSTGDHEYQGKSYNLGWMLDSDYAVHSVWLYSVYAVLGVNACLWRGVIELDDLTLCSATMVEFWMRQGELGDEDENNVEDMSGYEKSGVWLAWLSLEDHIWVFVYAGSGVVPAVSGTDNWLTQETLLSLSFSWWFRTYPIISLILFLTSTIS